MGTLSARDRLARFGQVFGGAAIIPEDFRNDAWSRWAWRVQLASTTVSVSALIPVLLDGERGFLRGLVALPIVLASIAWSWLSITAQQRLTHSTRMGIAFSMGDLALLVTLIQVDEVFGLLIFFVYWRMFSVVRPPWSIATAAVISIGIYKAFDGFSMQMLGATQLGVLALSLVTSAALAGFIGSIIVESQDRKALVLQLEATQAQLARQERDAGMAAERQRLAAELHDTLAQDFASIVLHLEAAGALVEPGSPPVPHLDAAKQTARSGLEESRRIVRALRPEMLQGRSLPEALASFCTQWSEQTGISAHFLCSGDAMSLPRDVDVSLYRGLQESLTNVRKHAQATGVVATLSYLGDEVILDVQDDGVGFVPEKQIGREDGHGVGLLTMRERVAAQGGVVTIESTAGEGTTVTLQIPAAPEGEPE